MKKIFNTSKIRLINIATVMLLLVFFLSSIMVVVVSSNKQNQTAMEFERLLMEVNNHNQNLMQEQDVVKEEDVVIFDNAAEAFIASYNNFFNQDSYIIKRTGSITFESLKLQIGYDVSVREIKHNNKLFSEIVISERGNLVDFGTHSYSFFYDIEKNEGVRQHSQEPDLIKMGDYQQVNYLNYSWSYLYIAEYYNITGHMPRHNLFNISRLSIVKQNYFKKNISTTTGLVNQYQTQVELNTNVSNEFYSGYMKYIFKNTGKNFLKELNFTSSKINAVLSSSALLKSAHYKDNFNVSLDLFGGIKGTGKLEYYNSFCLNPIPTINTLPEKIKTKILG